MLLQILLGLFSTMGIVSGIDYQGTRHRRMVLIDAFVSWNRAAELCFDQGGKLVTMENDEVFDALLEYRETVWTFRLSEFWLGLHIPSGGLPSEFVWESDCRNLSSYQPWVHDLPFPSDEKCVRADITTHPTRYWNADLCSQREGQVVCQVEDDECAFEDFEETKLQSDTRYSETALRDNPMSFVLCKTACLEYSGSVECWGFILANAANGRYTCTLYHATSYTAISQRQMVPADLATYYRKNCIGAELQIVENVKNQNRYTIIGMDDEPWMGCLAVVGGGEPTTTTSLITQVVSTSVPTSAPTPPPATVPTSVPKLVPTSVPTSAPTLPPATVPTPPPATVPTPPAAPVPAPMPATFNTDSATTLFNSATSSSISVLFSDREFFTETTRSKQISTNTYDTSTTGLFTVVPGQVVTTGENNEGTSKEAAFVRTSTDSEAHTTNTSPKQNCKISFMGCANNETETTFTQPVLLGSTTPQLNDLSLPSMNYTLPLTTFSTESTSDLLESSSSPDVSKETANFATSTKSTPTLISRSFPSNIWTTARPEKPTSCSRYLRRTHLYSSLNEHFMAAILENLAVEKSTISTNRHRFNCMADARTSAKIMGIVGIAMVMVVFVCIVISDIVRLAKYVHNLEGLQGYRQQKAPPC